MTMQSLIRRQMLAERKALNSEYINYYQPLLDDRLVTLIRQFSSVAIYSAIQNEVSVDCVMDHISHDAIALPKINNDELIFVDYEDPNLWQTGQYNILEPTTSVIDFVPEVFLVPLTAIDHEGVRIGMGKGYYDRYLESLKGDVILIGVGWDFQLVSEKLVRQSHDVPMNYFISPSYFIKF